MAGRLLALYPPPPDVTACSQGVWTCGAPVLVRNHDYTPSLFEGVIFSSAWTGRRVVGMGDCLWGLLDGMNDAGLAVQLAFGGRRVLEDAFGIPLVIRYMLEVCATVGEARVVLARLPVHQAYNLTLVNRSGAVLTAYPAPDRGAIFRPFPAATNHQDVVEWPEHARDTRTIEGQRYILGLLENPATTPAGLVAAFGQPPLYSTAYARHRDTLCTAPADGGPGGVPLARLCVDAVDAVVRGVRRGNSCSGVCRGPGRAARMVVPAGAVPLPGAR